MTFADKEAAATGEWADTHQPVVVAVDGSERNRSAVAWAAAEAATTGCEISLVTVVDDRLLPAPMWSVRTQREHAETMLARVRDEVRRLVPEQEVHVEVAVGTTVDVLLDTARSARLVVVGKRGLGSFARVLVGSTSIALAGRCPVPVTIVPDAWRPEDHGAGPVVLGLDPYTAHHAPVHLAFSRARRLGVRLVVVHGWETPAAYSWDAQAITTVLPEWEQEAQAEFDKVLDTWRVRFPDVEVEAVYRRVHPAMAVLDAAEEAQLVVLGRHNEGRLGGFAFGSVARAVLHYSECPVIVVPATED